MDRRRYFTRVRIQLHINDKDIEPLATDYTVLLSLSQYIHTYIFKLLFIYFTVS